MPAQIISKPLLGAAAKSGNDLKAITGSREGCYGKESAEFIAATCGPYGASSRPELAPLLKAMPPARRAERLARSPDCYFMIRISQLAHGRKTELQPIRPGTSDVCVRP